MNRAGLPDFPYPLLAGFAWLILAIFGVAVQWIWERARDRSRNQTEAKPKPTGKPANKNRLK